MWCYIVSHVALHYITCHVALYHMWCHIVSHVVLYRITCHVALYHGVLYCITCGVILVSPCCVVCLFSVCTSGLASPPPTPTPSDCTYPCKSRRFSSRLVHFFLCINPPLACFMSEFCFNSYYLMLREHVGQGSDPVVCHAEVTSNIVGSFHNFPDGLT